MTIWFASGNAHKKDELAAILEAHEILLPAAAGIGSFDPPETGTTFAENALIKARALRSLLLERGLGGPVIADDSGLCVDALGGRPGIFSSRYAGPAADSGPEQKLSGGERNTLLMAELGDNPQRTARFVCAMALLLDECRFFLVQETFEGEIIPSGEKGRGLNGFGYDPIFSIPGLKRTAAELSATEKNRLSHRGKASRAIGRFFEAGV